MFWALDRCGWYLEDREPFQGIPVSWVVPFLSLVLSSIRGFSVISPQIAGGLKSGTASRAARVGARASGAGRREGQGLEYEEP